ncbi:MAG: InlB B-repeat-containing protein, partial [Methanocorpusculum sp.]|nr:InlB B-repeat-containing protein [Methanocorpusculum sp.]
GNTGNLTKDGFKFVGWNTQKDGKGIDYPVGSTFTITDNITLYADWTEIEKYSITIQTIGPGTVTSDPASASEGELIHLHVSANLGYQLTQWYVYPEFITIHDDMTFLMPAEDVSFHGLFDKKDPEPIPRPKKSTSQGSSTWIQTPAPSPGDNTVATDVTYQYTGQKFIPVSAANLEQISAADPAAAAAADGIPLTNSKGAKAIVNTAESVPGTQTETFSQVIEVTSADGSKVTSVPFKVRLSDLAAKSLTTDDVTLYHYLEVYGLWIPLETGLVSTDDVYAYYEAATDGASPFGVLLKKLDAPEVKPVTPSGPSAKTPAPFVGVLAGLGAAVAVFGLRRK